MSNLGLTVNLPDWFLLVMSVYFMTMSLLSLVKTYLSYRTHQLKMGKIFDEVLYRHANAYDSSDAFWLAFKKDLLLRFKKC